MSALLAGATGLIGRELARQWSGPGTLHCLVRQPQVAGPHQAMLVVDFAALPRLPRADMALCALGTTIKVAGSQAAFRAVDLDAVINFARAAKAVGVRRFAVVSALGASARSSNFYSRTKGEMEQALRGLGFETLLIARPALLAGDRESLAQAARPGERITLAMLRPLAMLIPVAWRPIEAATVARALWANLAKAKPGVLELSSGAMQTLGGQQ